MTMYLDIKRRNGADLPEIAVDYAEVETADGKEYTVECGETEYTLEDDGYSSRCRRAGLCEGDFEPEKAVYGNKEIEKILGKGITRLLVGVSCLGEDGAPASTVGELEGSAVLCTESRDYTPAEIRFKACDGFHAAGIEK